MLNGRIDIKYRRVQCTPPANIDVIIDGNSGTGGWLRLSVTVLSPPIAHTCHGMQYHQLHPSLIRNCVQQR